MSTNKQQKRQQLSKHTKDVAIYSELVDIADEQERQTQVLEHIAQKEVEIPEQKDTVAVSNLPDVQDVRVTNPQEPVVVNMGTVEALLHKLLEKKTESGTEREMIDYTPILSSIADLIERDRPTNEAEVLDVLKQILEKKPVVGSSIHEDLIRNNRLKVEVDRIGGSFTHALLSTKQFETKMNQLFSELAMQIVEDGLVTYLGEASPGIATSDNKWRIRKIDETTGTIITWADGDSLFDNIMDDYASISYS